MPDCPACGAPVLTVPLATGDGTVRLDTHEAALGPGRYAVWDDGQARAVAAGAVLLAHPIHRCPNRPELDALEVG